MKVGVKRMVMVKKYFLGVILVLFLWVPFDFLSGFDLSQLEIEMKDFINFPGLPENLKISKLGKLSEEENQNWWDFQPSTPKNFQSTLQTVDFYHNSKFQRIIISILHFPEQSKKTKFLFNYKAGLLSGMNSGRFGTENGLSNGETFGDHVSRFDMEKHFPFPPDIASKTGFLKKGAGQGEDGFGLSRDYNVYYRDNDIGIIIIGQRELYDLRPMVDHIARVLNRKIHPPVPTKKK